jgi:type IV pilus assembly protein PilW
MKSSIRQNGVTLIELMVAMVLGLILLAAVLGVFIGTKQTFNRNQSLARMQEDARYALEEMTRDLSMAGFYAELVDPASITPDGTLAVANDCGPAGIADWMFQLVRAGGQSDSINVVDNASGADAAAGFACIDADTFQDSTDVVAVKRVLGAPAPALTAGRTYVRTNDTIGLLYVHPTAAAVAGATSDWEYSPRIYYIRTYANVPGDGIPTLCRKTLEAGDPPTVVDNCIAQGIEDLQIDWGLDADGDGSANYYVAMPTAAETTQVVTVRVSVLARSVASEAAYVNDKTYTMSNAPPRTPNDNFYRRVYTSTVVVHNVINLFQLAT